MQIPYLCLKLILLFAENEYRRRMSRDSLYSKNARESKHNTKVWKISQF
jgi:hypothetical protein